MTTLRARTVHIRRSCFARVLCIVLALACFAAPTRAEEEQLAEWKGTIRGQVVDGKRGGPVAYATVTLIWPAPADGSQARREQQVSDPNGGFEFPAIPAGVYTLEFSRTGYQTSTLVNFTVTPEQLDRADFQLPPETEPTPGAAPSAEPDETGDFEEFVVLGARVEALEASRAESDELINTLSAEEFSKFAASDVADALKFVAGVNVVEGQFAIIRGLEDRYSSTLYNGAPIPSPDPDRQSVQLDLFASDIVSNLVVAKTFGPDLPSNSSAGSINILTHDYPQDFEMKIQAGSGFNQNARQRFFAFNQGSAFGTEEDGLDTIESDFAGSLGGRFEIFEREIRFKGVVANEIDYVTAEGSLEGNQPRRGDLELGLSGDLASGLLSLSDGGFEQTVSERSEQRTYYGGIGFDLDEGGNHRIDGSIFDTSKKNGAVDLRENGYLPGFDYSELVARYQDQGIMNTQLYLPPGCVQAVCASFDAWTALGIREGDPEAPSNPRSGALWFSNFSNSRSFDFERDLTVYQLNGDHRFSWLDGFHLSYALNKAETTQTESALSARFSFEPDDEHAAGFVAPTRFPVTVEALEAAIAAASPGPTGAFYSRAGGLVQNENEVSEKGWFGRLDAEYELQLFDPVLLRIGSGIWFEDAKRDVASLFRDAPTVGGQTNWAVSAPTREILGELLFQSLDPSGLREATNDSERQIKAWNGGLKATFWQDLDLLGGLRIEDIQITSNNDPFTGTVFGAPETFPSAYLFFDRPDNPLRGEISGATTFNDQILGVDVPVGPCFAPGGSIPDPEARCVDLWNPTDPTDRSAVEALINGEIDELKFLPAVGIAYRPLEGMAVRGAWSRTVARPSFREMGFYASSELGSDELIVGNPQLQLSEVESWDLRLEYLWGEAGGFGVFGPGDLAAISAFYKTIQDPIEVIVVRDPLNLEGNALWRTFFNNENEATLWGIELEARKNLGFFGPELAEYFSIGGNFTYIDATVDRSDAEVSRAQEFFGPPGASAEYTALNQSRRLYGQPEWIANTDLSFTHPDWGTKITLVFFAISDLLDAAGTARVEPGGDITALTLDRYVDWFYTLDLVASETLPFDVPLEPIGLEGTIPSALTFKVSIKNLTDSPRGIIYDRAQTSDKVDERRFKVGRDYSFSLTYSFSF